MDRYSRQQVLPEVGPERQARLAAGHVAVVGLGALGSAVAEMLARAGAGHLSLYDRDVLELHNLQRQSLYTEADVRSACPRRRRLAAASRSSTARSQSTHM